MKKGDSDSNNYQDNSAINASLYSQSYYSRGGKGQEDVKKPESFSSYQNMESKLNSPQSSPYTPPYSQSSKVLFTDTNPSIPKAPKIEEPQVQAMAAQPSEGQSTMKLVLMTLLLLTTAGNLLMLGIMQLLFSDNGVLKLEWDGSFWYVYCLFALPLFFLGFKQVNKLQ